MRATNRRVVLSHLGASGSLSSRVAGRLEFADASEAQHAPRPLLTDAVDDEAMTTAILSEGLIHRRPFSRPFFKSGQRLCGGAVSVDQPQDASAAVQAKATTS